MSSSSSLGEEKGEGEEGCDGSVPGGGTEDKLNVSRIACPELDEIYQVSYQNLNPSPYDKILLPKGMMQAFFSAQMHWSPLE